MTMRRMVVATMTALVLVLPGAAAAQTIKIGFVQGISGPFEVYAKQEITGFTMGLEYATGGKGEVLGRKIEVLIEDDQLKPDVSKQKVTKLYADDKVDLIVGTTSSDAIQRPKRSTSSSIRARARRDSASRTLMLRATSRWRSSMS